MTSLILLDLVADGALRLALKRSLYSVAGRWIPQGLGTPCDAPARAIISVRASRMPLQGRLAVSGFVEIFNLFNRANYGAYNVVETASNFGTPAASTNLSYAPRTLQLGFRLTF